MSTPFTPMTGPQLAAAVRKAKYCTVRILLSNGETTWADISKREGQDLARRIRGDGVTVDTWESDGTLWIGGLGA